MIIYFHVFDILEEATSQVLTTDDTKERSFYVCKGAVYPIRALASALSCPSLDLRGFSGK
jgi:hypothetical protein